MVLRVSKVSSVAACIAFMALASSIDAQSDEVAIKELKQKIAVVRTSGPPSVARTNAAESIADLTSNLDSARLDDKTVRGLVSLLNTDDDSVRYWVAVALGNIGARARKAVPRLLRILAEVECQQASKTSEGGVRYALKQMGETPPPSNCER